MSSFSKSIVAGTIKATVVIGVNAGYFTPNSAEGVDLIKFGEAYKGIAAKVMEATGIYVGTIQQACKVLYRTEWGCPEGGEDAVRLEADCNPSYSSLPAAEYVAAWKQALLSVIEGLMEELDQTTVTIAFSGGDVVYIKRSKDAQ